ncbi:helix-turn-helix transcriptional regulator [Streptomyces sp. BE147]|uniref:helix-turn-helix domain-containing protein n=1 Tax=Streptomyces sp. BE147 TaxID=3002524 RepID=UPI002E77373C|nr:helix-turn-helix transcriptional regulator [Streptomyces sp. BE147]MEE1735502.1 helix-turn-helix transcriptional regulator [Streptomyces sp. BE147]
MGNTFSFSSDHCKWCGGKRDQAHTGRPGEYCSTKCRQAAHTHRQKGLPPDTADYDTFLHSELDSASAEIRDLQRALHTPGPAEQPLERLLELQRRIEQLTPALVGRTKRLGSSWEMISQLLGMNKDTVRKKYNSAVVQRALTRRHCRTAPARPGPRPGPLRPAEPPTAEHEPPAPPPASVQHSGTEDDGDTTEPSPDTGPARSPRDFACVLSNLQRASRHSLRTLSKKTGLSPSFLSRTMSGERFPTWEAAVSIARACGADPEVLKKVWEDADTRRRNRKPRPDTLDSALRYLHHRAGSPTAWSMSVSSGHRLAQDHITRLLDGTATGTWEDVQVLVQTLDGEHTYFEPLWKRATAHHTNTPTNGTTSASAAVATADHGSTSRIEELLTAFGNVLSNTTRPANSPTPPRRRHPAPIAPATTWIGR